MDAGPNQELEQINESIMEIAKSQALIYEELEEMAKKIKQRSGYEK